MKEKLTLNGKEYELNKIYNEDCYEAIKKIPDKSVDLIYTDVPYLMQSGGKGGGAFGDRIHNLIRKDMDKIIHGFDYKILNEFIRIMKKVNIFIWCNKQQILDIMNFFKDYSCEILVWCKTNATPFVNNVWLPDIEYCLYFRESGVSLNDGYNLKSKYFISSINKEDKEIYNHPTIKPLELVKRHILHTTKENDLVFDSFMGSGTTAVAAKELNRKFLGFEINKEYYDIACKRINGITANGQTSIFTDFDNL